MSDGQCCPQLEVVQVPGAPGTDGTAGVNGLDCVDFLQSPFVVPSTGGSISAIVTNNARFTVGQNIFMEGAGTFNLTSITGTTVMTLEYLTYASNTATGNTIAAGAQLGPGGYEATIPNPLPVLDGGTGATTAATARTNLGLPTGFHSGTFIANGATPVSVADVNVTAGSAIVITLKTVGGTVGATMTIQTITVSTGFTVKGLASDSSTYNYLIIG
jgi:hypothetical protein